MEGYCLTPEEGNSMLTVLDLKKQDATLYCKLMDWIGTFTPELDFEDSSFFAAFINHNLTLQSPYKVFVLYDPASESVLGTASIVPDDQDVGRELGLEGIWVAGVNIKREERGRGLGKMFFNLVDLYLADLDVPDLRANLFARNPTAISMYEKFGFRQTDFQVNRQGHEYGVYSKEY